MLPASGSGLVLAAAHGSPTASRRKPQVASRKSSVPAFAALMTEGQFRRAFLLLVVGAVTAAFLAMLQDFLLTILVAAIFAGLSYPVYARVLRAVRGHRPLASALTLLLMLVVVIGPLLGIVGVVVNQAIRVTESIRPVVQRLVSEPTYLDQQLRRVPGIDRLEPYREQIVTAAGNMVSAVGGFLAASLSSTASGTAAFLLQFFLLLYTMFFFLMDGPSMLQAILNHLPLKASEKRQMTERFVSVMRATVKGTIVIGIIQGALSGIAFWVTGIPDALFWTVVMIVLSILPVVGGALVWVPACLILAAMGQMTKALLLAAFCSLIVGSVDNVLRPRLVGRDTKLHDVLILFSTLGGILAFGPLGFIIGPILAGLFVTSWEIFAVAYRDVLEKEVVVVDAADDPATGSGTTHPHGN
jgi:predicted PurR-regulated permease PerM